MNPKLLNREEKFTKVTRNFYIGLIAFAYLFQFGLNPAGAFYGDSTAYGAGEIRDWNLFSLTGHSLRNWPIVFVNLLFGDTTLQTASQFIFATIVWANLIWNLHKFMRAKQFLYSGFLVVILAISPYVASWNSVLLGESYGISLLVLTITICFRWSYSKSEKDGICFFLCLLGWSSVQSRNYLALGVLLIVCLPLSLLLKKDSFNRRRMIFVAVLTVLFSYIGGISINQQNQNYDVAISYRALSNLYTFAAHSQSGIIKSDLKNQPGFDCMNITSMTDVIEISRKLVSDCPVALAWLENEYLHWYLKFLITHPVYTSKLLLEGLAASNNPSEFYSGTISIAPPLFSGLFFGSRNYSFGSFENVGNKMILVENDKQQLVVITKGDTKSYNAVKANAPIFLWIFLGLFLVIFRVRQFLSQKKQKNLADLDPMFLILVLSILGFVINLLICPAEYFKLTIQYSIALFLSVIMIISKIEFINPLFHVKNES